jgi:hypothetical protein
MRNTRNWAKEIEERRADPNCELIECLICGKRFIQVGSHIYQTHHITAREYRKQFGLDVKRGILPEAYRKLKSDTTRENGTIDNLKVGKKYWFKKGVSNNYERSQQTMNRLKHKKEVTFQQSNQPYCQD